MSVRPPTSATVATSLADEWTRLPDTIVAGSPDAWAQLVRPAARPQAEVDAERRTGVEWPAELREWFSLHDGGGSADLLPGMTLLGLEQMIDVHAMQCDAYPPTWSSLSAMLADLTNSIATGSPFNARYQPELDHTGLHWVLPPVPPQHP